MRPERLGLRPERLDLRPERLDLRPERPDLRSQCPDLRPEGPDEGGGTNEQTNERKSPVFYRTSSPSGPLPKKGEREKNRSPKGNMWSAIPVALL